MVVGLATKLEALVSNLNRPRVFERIIAIRKAAAERLAEWSHGQYLAARASIERLIEQGRHAEAVRAAQALHLKAESAGDIAYAGAAYDGAMAQITLGHALQMSGDAEAGIPHLEASRERFERLNKPRMAAGALTQKADCLTDLGRYDGAAEAYEQAIGMFKKVNDPRSVAASKNQLAAVRSHQKKYLEALDLYAEARDVFEHLNELAAIAAVWHQIGLVYEKTRGYEAAEDAYQKSLGIEIQRGNRSGEAISLGQLGNPYSNMGRREDAVRFYSQAADIAVQLGDLRSQGAIRNNIADELVKLGRYDEARREIERTIGCLKPFGHAGQIWKSFGILSNLERAVGNQPAALEARNQAIAAYLAYRRDGGAAQRETTQLVEMVNQDPAAARAALDDPDIDYGLAAEITLLLERLDP